MMNKKPIKEAVRALSLYLKKNYISSCLQMNPSTLNNKLSGNITKSTDNYIVVSRFTDEDVHRFNSWMPLLAEDLRRMTIVWSNDRQAVVDQVKRFRKIANMYYIGEQFLGLNEMQINKRCLNTSTKCRNTSFSQQDIDKLNAFIHELSDVVEQTEAQ